jgi:hypothetical protein
VSGSSNAVRALVTDLQNVDKPGFAPTLLFSVAQHLQAPEPNAFTALLKPAGRREERVSTRAQWPPNSLRLLGFEISDALHARLVVLNHLRKEEGERTQTDL